MERVRHVPIEPAVDIRFGQKMLRGLTGVHSARDAYSPKMQKVHDMFAGMTVPGLLAVQAGGIDQQQLPVREGRDAEQAVAGGLA